MVPRVRPSNKTWSLTVRYGSLHLDAPHGSFEVRSIAPEVMPVVKALPDGTDVECEGSFDGGGTITHLVVTRVRRILKDMSGRVMQLPDAIVAADGRLAAARARKHFAAGRTEKAAIDVESLLVLGDEQAIAEYEQLPPEYQQPMFEALVAWQVQQPGAIWRALRHIPLERWTEPHLMDAVEQSLANGGVFGAAPGLRVEEIIAELERRKRPTRRWEKQTQRLRRAQATEGDTFYRLTTELEQPRAIGADSNGVYVTGSVKFGESVVQQGAFRKHEEDRRVVVVYYALDGREIQRWVGLVADRIVEGVALQIEADEPAGVRISDGKPLYTFAHRIEHHDGELLWGIHARDAQTRTMRSEIRHIATGYTIAKLDGWVDDVTWNGQHIFIHGASPQTLTREGRVVSASVPPPPSTIDIESASGRHTIPAEHAPWLFAVDAFTSVDAGGWIAHVGFPAIYLAASEPGATWVHLELGKQPARVDLAPPWLAIHSKDDGPIILVALAEAMSAQEIRVDGKRFARRAKATPGLAVSDRLIAWYRVLVEQGVMSSRSEAERDALLFRAHGTGTEPPADVLARMLVGNSNVCLSHADYYVDADDDIFDRLTVAFAADDIAIREVERKNNDDDDDDDDDDAAADEVTLTLQATRGERRLTRQCGWGLDSVLVTVDKMVDELGAKRRIFALHYESYHRRAYLVITKEQRQAIVAAGIEGIRSGPRSR